ncbi:MAG: helix-turn-helix transcriptional regulator [Tepidisphaeraceae bacterium]
MTVRTVRMDGRDYVLVPRKQWEKMTHRPTADQGKAIQLPPALPDGSYTLDHVRLSLANKMISRRKAAGLTQARLAKLARVRVETISRLENGLHMPSSRTFDQIDRALTRASKRPAA